MLIIIYNSVKKIILKRICKGGETNSHVWFAYKEGILVESTAENFYEGTMAFSGQMSGTSANSSESISSLKLIKWLPKNK